MNREERFSRVVSLNLVRTSTQALCLIEETNGHDMASKLGDGLLVRVPNRRYEVET